MGALSGVLMADAVITRREAGRFASPLSRGAAALLLALATLVSLVLTSTHLAAVAYVYDGGLPTAPLVEASPVNQSSDQGVHDRTLMPGGVHGGYDDTSNLARASARIDVFRSAPRALDDVATSRLWSRTEFGGNRVTAVGPD